MTVYLLALAIGIVAGLRAMIPLAAISWAAQLGWLDLDGTWFAFLGYVWTPWVLSAVALGELVADQLPSTPSRTVPIQFATRLFTGGAAGALLALGTGVPWIGALVAGILGAVAGTLGGRAVRARLAAAFGRDRPAALIEDAVAIAGAVAILLALP
jgi:uncharacterized membrane protein